MTVLDLVAERGRRQPFGSALLGSDGTHVSNAELSRQVAGIAAALERAGLGAGDRVAVLGDGGVATAIGILGAAARTTAVPTAVNLPPARLASTASRLGVRAVVTAGVDRTSVTSALPDCVVVDLDDAAEDAACVATATDREDDVALITETAGTTAAPKLVPFTHRRLVASARAIADTLGLGAGDRGLAIMPLHHAHGLIGGLLAALVSDGVTICAAPFDPLVFRTCLRRLSPTWYSAVPAVHEVVIRTVPADEAAAAGLRFVRSSSAPLGAGLRDRLASAFAAPVIESYGMSESFVVATSGVEPRPAGAVGRPVAGVDVRAIDEEIQVRSPLTFDGYLEGGGERDPFDDGWFRTGDLGRVDDEGFVHVRGRASEIINKGGEKISPYELEEVLRRHSAVADVVAFPVPDRALGEEVAVLVVLAASNVIDDEGAAALRFAIRRFVAAHLERCKVPAIVEFVDRVPLTRTGKVPRRRLAAELGLCRR